MALIRRAVCRTLILLSLVGAGILVACSGSPPQGEMAGDGSAGATAGTVPAPSLEGEFGSGPPAPGDPSEDNGVAFTDLLGAREVLNAALAEAGRTERLVFLHSGADW